MWATDINLYSKVVSLCMSIFCMSNLEISRFDMQRDLVTHTGEREIGAVTRRLPDNPRELAYRVHDCILGTLNFTGSKQMVPKIFYIL